MTDKQTAVAHHEAGHAVIAWTLGRAFQSISIEPGEHTQGRVAFGPYPKWLQPDAVIDGRTRRLLEQYIMTSWAGMLAESEYRGRRPNQSTYQGDLDRVVDLASYVTGEPEELAAYVEWLRLRTRNTLWAEWERVEALVAALLENTSLSYRRARAIIMSRDPAATSPPSLPGRI